MISSLFYVVNNNFINANYFLTSAILFYLLDKNGNSTNNRTP
jgi:hypothetical protein